MKHRIFERNASMMDIIHIDTLHYLSLNLPKFLVMCVSRMIIGSTNTSILSFVDMFFFVFYFGKASFQVSEFVNLGMFIISCVGIQIE